GFEAAHRKQRVAEGDDDYHDGELQPHGSLEPALRVLCEMDIGDHWSRRHVAPTILQDDRQRAPDDQDRHHYGGDLHDAQRLPAGFVDALDVLPPKIGCDQHRETGVESVHRQTVALVHQLADFV